MIRHVLCRSRWLAFLLALVALMLAGMACGDNGSPGTTGLPTTAEPTTAPPTTGPAVPGSITATVSSVKGQNGSTLSIGVYDFDWSPGAPNTFVGLIYAPITSDDFSSSVVVTGVGADGSPTKDPAILQPGTYSVVFFVVPPGSPPKIFSEVRAIVAGDITVSAPAWGSW
ncbi:MAG: hypothetical protein A2133_00225 [Actinobacteria bacterium RBG_16_64_13]|nr:MAG: hypothetical protein A2133_00225 [Actinobacteria bacterium RBG_16_64_13]